MNTDIFRKELKNELRNILHYWIKNAVDEVNGGFYGKIDYFNIPDPESSKGIILNTRILWTFAAACNFFEDDIYLKTAERAYRYLIKHFLDTQHGGLYWETDNKGRPLNKRKQIYAQAFGIYGLSEYHIASGNKESLALAENIFNLIEKYSYDSRYNGYLEALDGEWRKLDDMRLSDKEINVPKTMNTHLHILEAYTNLNRIRKNGELRQQTKRLIETFLNHIINHDTFHFSLFFENNWTARLSIDSYGHDIEGSWLLTEAAETVDDDLLLKTVQDSAVKMTDTVIREGFDKNSSVYYEYDRTAGHLDTDKHWWPQGEAMVGLVNTWQITGERKYLDLAYKIWDFIKTYIINKEHGEWDARLNNKNEPYEEDVRAGFWKCPYHNARACIEVIRRLG